jgi:hypothetical protein
MTAYPGPASVDFTKNGDAAMRFVLCILLGVLPSNFAFAAKGTMSLSEAQAAAAKGDTDAAAAIMLTTDRQTWAGWRGGRWWPWSLGAGAVALAATWPYGGYGYGYDSCVAGTITDEIDAITVVTR